MTLQEVKTAAQKKEFIKLPVRLYKGVKEWIQPLDKDIEAVFDSKENKTFRNGRCIRWILTSDSGETIGRVAAFVNDKTANKGNDQPTGGLGFFECIDDKEAAFTLFDACKDWLVKEGMEAMDGPINFGERDIWWGLLIDGFDREPNYRCNYNFPYYKELFEAYGFQVYFNQFTFGRDVFAPFSEKLLKKAALVDEQSGYTFEHIRKKNLDKYIEDFTTIYNNAWAGHGVPKLSTKQVRNMMKTIKPIMDEKIITFVYYEGKPAAVYMNIPEINQIFKYVNGKMNLIGKLKFLYHQAIKSNKKMLGIVFGVVREYQGKGIDGWIIRETGKIVQGTHPRYPLLEMNWIGDFNPKMIAVAKQLDADVVKTHATYRKLFDDSKPFKRAPILG